MNKVKKILTKEDETKFELIKEMKKNKQTNKKVFLPDFVSDNFSKM